MLMFRKWWKLKHILLIKGLAFLLSSSIDQSGSVKFFPLWHWTLAVASLLPSWASNLKGIHSEEVSNVLPDNLSQFCSVKMESEIDKAFFLRIWDMFDIPQWDLCIQAYLETPYICDNSTIAMPLCWKLSWLEQVGDNLPVTSSPNLVYLSCWSWRTLWSVSSSWLYSF